MRKFIGYVVSFAVVMTVGCTVKVNGEVHKFGLTGEETPPEKKDGEKKDGEALSPDELAAQLAAGTTPTGSTVTLKSDFAPNPSAQGPFSSKAEVSISDQPHGISNCSGYVGESPAATIKFTSAMKNTRISAPGAALIVAEFGDRKYICDEGGYNNEAPSVMLNPEWPADDIKIFVGGRKDQTYNYQLKVEDETRPIDILWKGKVKTIDMAEIPKEPVVVSELTTKDSGVKGRCGDSYFRDAPDLAFSLKRPLGDISIDVRSAKPVDVEIVGPLTDDGRKIPSHCMNDDRYSFGRMEAGIYGLRIGTKSPGAEVLYHVVVRGKETKMNPILPPSKFVDEATVDESVITWHFPQLLPQDTHSDPHREALFLTTPKPVFVFPKFNMDKSVADALGGGSDKSKNEYPKENEPLLLLDRNGQVMGADGAEFRVTMKDLQADPGGAIAVPAAPRNTALSFDAALAAKGPEDAKAVAAWEKAEKAEQSCHDRQRSSVEGGFENACAGMEKATDKAKEALEKELAKNRVARRAASLAKLKTRLETLFKK